jgi:hypothetical protein
MPGTPSSNPLINDIGRQTVKEARIVSGAVDAEASLPWPPEWSKLRRTASRALAVGLLGLLVLGLVGVGTSSPDSGQRGGPMAILTLGVMCSAALVVHDLWIAHVWRRVPSRAISLRATGSGNDGVAVPCRSRISWMIRTLVLVNAVLVAAYATGGALGWMTSASGAPPDIASLTGGAALCLLLTWAVWVLWVVVELAGGRIVRGRLVLRDDGVYHRSYTFEHFVPWHAVVDVSPTEFREPVIVVRAVPTEETCVRRTARAGAQQEYKLLPFIVVRARSLAVNPALVYHALRYYHAHPEARAELRGPAGEQRIRRGNVLG